MRNKVIKVTTDKTMTVVELGEPIWGTMAQEIGAELFEIIRPVELNGHPQFGKIRIIVDESGKLNRRPYNPVASVMYDPFGRFDNIVGDVLFMEEVMTEEGPDVMGLDENLMPFMSWLQEEYGI